MISCRVIQARAWLASTSWSEPFSAEGQEVLGWRDVPVDNQGLGEDVIKRLSRSFDKYLSAAACPSRMSTPSERKLYIIRKRAGHAIRALGLHHAMEYYVPSFSARTIVYKGMLLAHQVGQYYKDLQDPDFTSP